MKKRGKKKDPDELDRLLRELGFDPEKAELGRVALTKSSGFKKIESYVKTLLRNLDFLEEVKLLRKTFKIPALGFPVPKNETEFNNIFDKHNFNPIRNDKLVENESYINELASKYNLGAFPEFVKSVVLFNDIRFIKNFYIETIHIFDAPEYYLERMKNNKTKKKPDDFDFDMMREFARHYPVGIFIHPYMTQNDIIDTIKRLYKFEIKPLQEKYGMNKSGFGTSRRKSKRVEDRNNFIYENRVKPTKELVKLVREKFNDILDYTYIQKIIRDERLRRN